MTRFILRLPLLFAGVAAAASLLLADSDDVKKPAVAKPDGGDKAAQKPAKFHPPRIRLRAAAKVT